MGHIPPCPARKHLAMSGSILGCHTLREAQVLLASSGEVPGSLLSILQCPGQLPTTTDYLAQNVNSADAERPCFRLCGVLGNHFAWVSAFRQAVCPQNTVVMKPLKLKDPMVSSSKITSSGSSPSYLASVPPVSS